MEGEVMRGPYIPVGTMNDTDGVVKCRLEVTETACIHKTRLHISIVTGET